MSLWKVCCNQRQQFHDHFFFYLIIILPWSSIIILVQLYSQSTIRFVLLLFVPSTVRIAGKCGSRTEISGLWVTKTWHGLSFPISTFLCTTIAIDRLDKKCTGFGATCGWHKVLLYCTMGMLPVEGSKSSYTRDEPYLDLNALPALHLSLWLVYTSDIHRIMTVKWKILQ